MAAPTLLCDAANRLSDDITCAQCGPEPSDKGFIGGEVLWWQVINPYNDKDDSVFAWWLRRKTDVGAGKLSRTKDGLFRFWRRRLGPTESKENLSQH